jgi:dTDP-4-dehydrorhamnose reductase
MYTEEDAPHPLGWYAQTKSEGAKRVLSMGEQSMVVRISNPYRAHPVGKKDFVHKMLERMLAHQDIVAPDDQIFVPTFIDDIALALDKLMTTESHGIFHVVGSQALSPYSAAVSLARLYGQDTSKIQPTTFSSYFAGKAPVPQKAVLSNDKIQSLGVVMHGFDDGIVEMKRQEEGL